jgi:hypothetical protein
VNVRNLVVLCPDGTLGRDESGEFVEIFRSEGRPTFLNLDEPYPNEILTILIWGDDRSKFGTPETEYRDKHVCVTGKITSYRGTPEIVATEPSQIVSQK